MKIKFEGTCQCCDRTQRLPDGGLAKHGYRVIGKGNGGFFSGVCPGSHHLPLEVSCELAAKLAKEARDHAQRLLDRATQEGKPSVDGMGWYHEYVPATWACRQSHYKWVHIQYKEGQDGNSRYTDYRPVLEKATDGNKKYAEWLRNEAKQAIRYAEDRERVCKDWKPGKPREVKVG